MIDFSKLRTVKTWRVYIGNCPASGNFDYDELTQAQLLAIKMGGRVVLEYITVQEN